MAASIGASQRLDVVAYHARMRSGGKACWKTILLEGPGQGAEEPHRQVRLAALYRFQNGEAPAGLRFVDPSRAAAVTDPAEIDWTHFPVLDALEAVTRDELRRLRALLSAEATPTPSPAPAFTPSPPVAWGVDPRRAAPPTDA